MGEPSYPAVLESSLPEKNHKKFNFKHQGRRFRLTDVLGHMVKGILS